MKIYIDQKFLRTDIARFIETYFSEDFNQAVARHVGLRERTLVEQQTLATGRVRRRVRMIPEIALPAPIQRLLGDKPISYDEVSEYDPSAYLLRYHIESAAQDRVRVEGEIRFIEENDGVRRIIDGEAAVQVFGLGGMIERLIESEVRKGYERIGAFMQRWLEQG